MHDESTTSQGPALPWNLLPKVHSLAGADLAAPAAGYESKLENSYVEGPARCSYKATRAQSEVRVSCFWCVLLRSHSLGTVDGDRGCAVLESVLE